MLALAAPALAIDLQLVTECSSMFCYYSEPVVSPDGGCVAFTNATAWPLVWFAIGLVPVDGSCPALHPEVSALNEQFSPAWSPDGTRMAFVSFDQIGDTSGIWTVEAGDLGSPPTSLVRVVAGVYAQDPAWSLDAGWIAYVGEGGTYVVPSSGGAPNLVAPGGLAPSWGPDGQLVFSRDGDLWIRESDGKERQLTRTADPEAEPAWSPAGTWIAYAWTRAGNKDIWVIAASGGTPVRVTLSPAEEMHPTWSAAGDRLVFVSEAYGQESFWLAKNFPDWTTAVETRTWTFVKQLFR